MKDFIILCAKIALGVLIAFAFIFGGTNSISKKSRDMQTSITTEINKVNLEVTQ